MIETYRTVLSFYYQERQTNNIKVLATFYIKAYISYFLKTKPIFVSSDEHGY